MWMLLLKEHQTTKKMVVEKLQTELAESKKELRKRGKIIGIQQQIIHSGNESYNKVKLLLWITVIAVGGSPPLLDLFDQ